VRGWGIFVCKRLLREKREFNGCEVLQVAPKHLSGKGNLEARYRFGN
jgi:hypothetical protein